MTILADGSLKNFTRQIMPRRILDLVEMTRRTEVCRAKEIGLTGRMNKVFFRVRVWAIDDLAGGNLESWWRSRLIGDCIDQVTGGAADALNLGLSLRYLSDNPVYVLRKYRDGGRMTRKTMSTLLGGRIRLKP